MIASKLRAWLERQRVGAHRVVLEHDSPGESEEPFASFPMDPIPDVEAIYNACGDLADSREESIRVAIKVLSEDDTCLAKIFHKQAPIDAPSNDAMNAADASTGTIITTLLRHLEVQQRVMTGSQASIYSAFEKTLARMEKVIERQATVIADLTEALRDLRIADEETEEDRQAAAMKRQAFEKLAEYGPMIGEYLLAHAARLGNGNDAANPHVNGHATAA